MVSLSLKHLLCVFVLMKTYVLVETGFNLASVSTSNGSTSVDVNRILLCQTLNNLFRLQDLQNPEGHLFRSTETSVIIVIFQDSSAWLAVKFQDYVSVLNEKYIFLDLHISDEDSERDIAIIINVLNRYYFKAQTVVMLLETSDLIKKIMKAVCSKMIFRWTHLLHTTEWIVVSESSTLYQAWKFKNYCVDYATLIFITDAFVNFADQSECSIFINSKKSVMKSATLIRNLKRDNSTMVKKREACGPWTLKDLRDAFPDLAIPKKISLRGLHLPVAILTAIQTPSDGNETRYEAYTLAVLNVMASAIGFTYTLVTPTDGGAFGVVNEDGTTTGLVGLVARREVAFCALGMNKIDNRLTAIDFLDFQVEFVPIRIMYKLPQTENELDMTFLDVFKTEFLLSLIGPVLIIGLIGGFTHLATKSCSVAAPGLFKAKDIRKLNTCPTHVCFQRNVTYTGQTGRILRASWGIFLLILTSAYSALLVTNLTVKPEELKIDSFETLLANPSYRIGIEGSASAMITLMTTTIDPVLRELGQRIAAFSKTNPWTYSQNMSEQMAKVLEGDYAFLSYQATEDIPLYVNGDYSDVRDYPVDPGYGLGVDYITLPRNVFYKDELNSLMLDLEETGILLKLWEKYKVSTTSEEASVIESEKPIPLSRLMVFMYITLGGIGAGCVCLVGEIVLRKFLMECIRH